MNSVQHNRFRRGTAWGLPGMLLIASIWGISNTSFARAQLPFQRNQTKQQVDKPHRHAPSQLMVTPRRSQPLPAPEMESASSRRAQGPQSNDGSRSDSDVRRANFQQSQGTIYQSPSLPPEINSMPDTPDYSGPPQGRMGPGFSEPNFNRSGSLQDSPIHAPRPSHYPIRQNVPANEIIAPTNTLDGNYGMPSGEHPENNSQYSGSLEDQSQNSANPDRGGPGVQFEDGNGQAFGQQHYGNGQGHLHDGANLYGRRLGMQQPSATERALSFQDENLRLKENINRMQQEVENRDRQLERALTNYRNLQQELTKAQNLNYELKNQATVLTRERDTAIKMRENSERQYNEQLKGIETMLDSALITELSDKK